MPDKVWMEVRDIVQETGIKTIPMEKKCQKAKGLSEDLRKEKQKSKMAVRGGLTNSCEKRRSEKQRRKGKI